MGINDIIKGFWGETLIAGRLGWSNLFGYKGRVLRNVYVPKDDSTTTEIDLLFITQKGIFVIESKNYVGYIFGTDTNQKWTVSVYKGKGFWGQNKTQKFQFFNPIKQNKIHIKWLNNYLAADIQMFSCIVFSDNCELKSIDISHSYDVVVCHGSGLNRSIRYLWGNYPDSLTDEQINEIYNALLPLTNQTTAVKKKHIEDIKEKQNSVLCPLCGKPLVVRTAMRGSNAGKQFYGCSAYPNCRYTRNID